MNRLNHFLALLLFSFPLAINGQTCTCENETFYYIDITIWRDTLSEPQSVSYIVKDSNDIASITDSIVFTQAKLTINNTGILLAGSIWGESYHAILSDECNMTLKEKDDEYNNLLSLWMLFFKNEKGIVINVESSDVIIQVYAVKIIGRIKERFFEGKHMADIVHIDSIESYGFHFN